MIKESVRTIKYYWIKKWVILFGLIFSSIFPLLTYAWLGGRLAIEGENIDPLLQQWSNPGMLSVPIFFSFISFFVGLLILLYVVFRCDIDDVLPEKHYE